MFVALVSPDYIASRYCYEKEFERALSRADAGQMKIVPVILEPCDWLATPLRDFLALPKDGQPISSWTNENLGFLDVVSGLRRILESNVEEGLTGASAARAPNEPARRPRVKQHFDAIERAEFADKAFEVIRSYFRASCDELSQIEDLRARFEEMSPIAFTCSVVNRGLRDGGEANITVHNTKGNRMGFGDISYVHERFADANKSNGTVRVLHDDYAQFVTLDTFGYGTSNERLTPEQAADRLWIEFIKRAGIDYE